MFISQQGFSSLVLDIEGGLVLHFLHSMTLISKIKPNGANVIKLLCP
jgi:hypothetical protein